MSGERARGKWVRVRHFGERRHLSPRAPDDERRLFISRTVTSRQRHPVTCGDGIPPCCNHPTSMHYILQWWSSGTCAPHQPQHGQSAKHTARLEHLSDRVGVRLPHRLSTSWCSTQTIHLSAEACTLYRFAKRTSASHCPPTLVRASTSASRRRAARSRASTAASRACTSRSAVPP